MGLPIQETRPSDRSLAPQWPARQRALLAWLRDSIRIHKLSAEPTERVIGVGRVVGKGRREREFLVDAHALRLVYGYLTTVKLGRDNALFLSNRGRRIDKRTVQHMLRALSKRLNLPPIHPHQLRSTFATRLNRTGVPTLEISRLLGHASLETTMIYVQPDERKNPHRILCGL